MAGYKSLKAEVGQDGLVIGTDLKQIDYLEDVVLLNYSVEDPELQEYPDWTYKTRRCGIVRPFSEYKRYMGN